MKKIVIALTALAGITLMSGCAYDYYPYYYGHYAYGYGYHPFYGYGYGLGYRPGIAFSSGLGWDCVHHWSATYCRA